MGTMDATGEHTKLTVYGMDTTIVIDAVTPIDCNMDRMMRHIAQSYMGNWVCAEFDGVTINNPSCRIHECDGLTNIGNDLQRGE